MRNLLVIVAVLVIGIGGCSNDGSKLTGAWTSENGDSTMIIKSGNLLFDYVISVSGARQELNQACKTLVLYSNNGFNCYGFPDKTARIMYQSNLQPESDILVAASVNDESNFTAYHHLH